MRAKLGKISIDRLKLCYRHNHELFDYLISEFNLNGKSENERTIDFYDFLLVLLDHEEEDDKTVKMIVAADFFMDGEMHRLGNFEFSVVGMYRQYCFFEFTNKSLYTPFSVMNGNKSNVMCFIDYIADTLHLEFNNVTLAELAFDSNVNIIARLRKTIKDIHGFDMFLNGSMVKDSKCRLNNYGEYYSRSRERITKQPTIYFKQAKDTGLSMRIYNKSRQMQESELAKLNYIPDWLDFGEQQIYRAEITIRNTDIADFCTRTGHDKDGALYMLMSEDWRAQLWQDSTHRLMFFRDKHTGEDIELIDLL